MRKKRVRERDVCFMSKEWEAAIRNKRKYAIQFVKDRTPENFELKKKYRNIATRERRKALTAYWYKKSEEMKNQRDVLTTQDGVNQPLLVVRVADRFMGKIATGTIWFKRNKKKARWKKT